MLNQVILIGRIKNIFNEGTYTLMELTSQRPYKNEEGIYPTDIIEVRLTGNIADRTRIYCKQGDLVGIKGRLETERTQLQIIVSKITFLSSTEANEEADTPMR